MAVEYGINRIGDDHAISAIFAGDGVTSYSKVVLGRRVTNAFDLVLNVAPTVLPSTAKIRSGFALDQYDAIYATATEPAAKLYSFGIATRTDGAVYCVNTPSGGLREVYHPLIGFCLIDGRGGLYVSQSFGLPLNDAGNGAVDTAGFLAGATVSFTRATAASTRLSNGLLKTDVASGVARSWYAADGTYLGYLSELAATNVCLQSNAFGTTWADSTGTPTQVKDAVGPDGLTSAWTVTDDSAAQLERKRQDIAIAADTTQYVVSGFYEKTSGAASFPSIGLWFAGSSGTIHDYLCNTDAGTLTKRNTATAALTTGVEDWGDFWRFYISAANPGLDTFLRPNYCPAVATSDTATWDNATTGSAVIYGFQVEVGSSPSTYIPTTTAAVTRNADVLSYTSAPDFGAQGSLYCEVTPLSFAAGSAKTFMQIENGGNNERIFIGNQSATQTTSQVVIADGGVQQAAVSVTSSLSQGQTTKIAASWETNRVDFAAAGTLGTRDTSATMPTTDRILIGRTTGGLNAGGCIKNVNITSQIRTDLASITG